MDMKGGQQSQGKQNAPFADFNKFKSKGLSGISQVPPMMQPGFFGQQGSSSSNPSQPTPMYPPMMMPQMYNQNDP